MSDWPDRLAKLKDLGCNALSTYVPWLVHEEVEGEIDLVGRQVPNDDVTG